MGLDGVELVMAVEEDFGISLSDADAANCLTPGDLIDVVMRLRGRTDKAACRTQKAFHGVRRSLMKHLGIKRNAIHPDTPLIPLLPKKRVRELMRLITADLGMELQPAFQPPLWVHLLSLSAITIFFLALLKYPMNSWLWFTFFLLCVIRVSLKNYKPVLPKYMSTVGQFCQWVVSNNPALIASMPGELSREEAAQRVRKIVIDQLGLKPGEYSENARFIEDLGVG